MKNSYIPYKALDHIRKKIREGHKPSIYETGSIYWVTDGYCAFSVNAGAMELNPAMFRTWDASTLLTPPDNVCDLKSTGLYEIHPQQTLIPFLGDGFTAWINKRFLDLFPASICLKGTTATAAVYVYNFGELIGIICPVRHEKELPQLF